MITLEGTAKFELRALTGWDTMPGMHIEIEVLCDVECSWDREARAAHQGKTTARFASVTVGGCLLCEDEPVERLTGRLPVGNPKHSEGAFKLEAGKRYVSEKGLVTEALKTDSVGDFINARGGVGAWHPDGYPWGPLTSEKYGRLIRDYIESPKGEEVGSVGPAAPVRPMNLKAEVRAVDIPEIDSGVASLTIIGDGWSRKETFSLGTAEEIAFRINHFNQAPAPSGLSPAVLSEEEAEKLINELIAAVTLYAKGDGNLSHTMRLRLAVEAHLTGKGGKL